MILKLLINLIEIFLELLFIESHITIIFVNLNIINIYIIFIINTYISTNNEIHQDAIEIGDDDEEFTFAGLVEETDPQIQQQIIENIGQQNLVQIDQSQNQEQQLQPQQNHNLNKNPQDPFQETYSNNNNLISDQIENLNQNADFSIESLQKNIEKIDSNKPPQENNEENEINPSIIQNDLIKQNNTTLQDYQQNNQTRQLNDQYSKQDIPQIPDSNNTEEKHLQIENQQLILQDNQDISQKNVNNIHQENLQQEVDHVQNQLQTEIKDDSTNYNNQSIQQNQSIVEQFKTNDPDVEIIDPPIKFLNNKDLKKLKANNKFKINILKNNVKIAEPMMEEIHDNLFFEFVNHMKKEMVKKLSDIQYYNTLLG